MSERQRSATALSRLRDRQRDAAAMGLSAARRRQRAAETEADACRQRMLATESACVAQHAAGAEFDPQLAGLARNALDAALIAVLHADARTQEAAAACGRAQRQCMQHERDRRLAERFRHRVEREDRLASAGTDARDALQALQAQHRQQEWP